MAQRERMKLYSFNVPSDRLDEAREIAAARGDQLSTVLREALELYIRWAGSKPPD